MAFIDDEWVAATGVDLELVAIRACWKLATGAIGSGTRHPWPVEPPVNDLTIAFCQFLARGGLTGDGHDDTGATNAGHRITIGNEPLDRYQHSL